MFEHLDDPAGLGPAASMRDAVVRTGRRRRRARRLAWTGLSAVAVVGGTAIAAYAYVDRKVDQVERVKVANLAADPPRGEPYVVLLQATDDASRLPADDPVRSGRDEVIGARADVAVLVRIDPGAETVTTMALPRDLRVALPDGGAGRLNSILDPAHRVRVIRDELGIEVSRYVETDFAGAVAVGDALGGIRLEFQGPVRDARSGLALDGGCQAIDGRSLLALGRARHLQIQAPDGSWQLDPTGDLGRIARQGPILEAGLRAFSTIDPRSPAAVDRLLDAVVDHVAIDASMTKADLIDLFRDVAGSELRRVSLPVREVEVDGAAMLEQGDGAAAAVERFLDGAPAEPGSAPQGGGGLDPQPAVVPSPC